VAELLGSGPVLGVAYLVAVTAYAFAGAEDQRVLGVRASAVVAVARTRFADDVRALTASMTGLAVALGAALGVAAELVLLLRSRVDGADRSLGRRIVFRAACVVAGHLLLLAWGVAAMPSLYAGSLYAREDRLAPLGRTLQVLLTDVLGTTGVGWLALAAVVFAIAPWRRRGFAERRARRVGPSAIAALRAAVERTGERRVIVFAAGVLALLLLVAGGSLLRDRRVGRQRRLHAMPNVLILAADSLRDDRLAPATAPHLADLARGGARFDHAYVTLPRTLPSWSTILTGREPHHHGLRTMFPRYEDRARDLHALPARLAERGYRTGVVGDYAADIFTRIRYGFERVDAPTFNFHALIATRAIERATPLLPLLQSGLGRTLMPAVDELNQASDPRWVATRAERMIDELADGDAPFFATVFFSTAHFPYAAPAPWYRAFSDGAYRGRFKFHKPNVAGQELPLDEADVRQVRALYDGAVASIDDAAAGLLARLGKRGLLDDTIVVVTADHGEMLYEDGHGQGHGDHLFGDQVVHVPLAMSLPARFAARSGLRIEDPVRDVDFAPTLLDLIGAPVGEGDLDGRSLRPLLEGRALPPRPVFAETEVWMTENIPELPARGPNALRIPYPNVAMLTELDPRLGHDVVMRAEAEDVVLAAKHRMIRTSDKKLVYVPTRQGARWMLFDCARDPAERIDVAAAQPEVTAALRAQLLAWMLGDPRLTEREGLVVPRSLGDVRGATSGAMRLP
jgi:arylsulfatase A-like enzyme